MYDFFIGMSVFEVIGWGVLFVGIVGVGVYAIKGGDR